MPKVKKRIVRQVYPNTQIREWHTTHPISAIAGHMNNIECRPGVSPKAREWDNVQSTIENSPKAFALASAIAEIPGVKEVSIERYKVRVEIEEAFDFDMDKIADSVTLETKRHVYSLRQKVAVSDHEDNLQAVHDRHSPPTRDEMYMM
jgi:hypothetical protein